MPHRKKEYAKLSFAQRTQFQTQVVATPWFQPIFYTLWNSFDQPDEVPYSVVEHPLGQTPHCIHSVANHAHGVCNSTGAKIEEAAHHFLQEVAISYSKGEVDSSINRGLGKIM